MQLPCSDPPANEPAEGEHADCDCGCGEFSGLADIIYTYELHDADHNVIGWMVVEFYGVDALQLPSGENWEYFDIDGNQVDTIVYDHAELLNTEYNNGWVGPHVGPKGIIEKPEGDYQIDKIAAKITEMAAKLAQYALTGQIPDFEVGAGGKAAKKIAYEEMKKRIKKIFKDKLLQVHHAIPQTFFKKKYNGFFKSIGFDKDHLKNVVPLPTKAGKKSGVGLKRSLHDGGHIGKYFDDIDKEIDAIETAFNTGKITKIQAQRAVRDLQEELKKGLRDGTIPLHHPETLNSLLPFALLGASATEREALEEDLANQQVKMFDEVLKSHGLNWGRVQHYTGDEGAAGWLGWILDLFNPLDDIATIGDIITFFDYDPTKESPAEYFERMRKEGCHREPTLCFEAGTEVHLVDGSTLPIEKIVIGDEVWAYDLDEKKRKPARVFRTLHSTKSEKYTLHVANETLSVTREHPFFVVGQGWTPVKELQFGMELLDIKGEVHIIERIEIKKENIEVYNISVEGLRNYFVGQTGILVHNK